jgi:hypothetical protein
MIIIYFNLETFINFIVQTVDTDFLESSGFLGGVSYRKEKTSLGLYLALVSYKKCLFSPVLSILWSIVWVLEGPGMKLSTNERKQFQADSVLAEF